MMQRSINRRKFLTDSVLGAGAGILTTSSCTLNKNKGFPNVIKEGIKSPNERLRFGAIGVGGRGASVANSARRLSDIIAICDLDTKRTDRVNKSLAKGQAVGYQDYRRILDRSDIDFVTIGTTDHWHTRIAIQAMQSGKDVYCEKPLTLTIEEGKQICQVAKETGRVFQVGTQQRTSDRFLTAIGIIREGRIGKIQKITCNIGSSPQGGPFEKSDPPPNLDWNMWLGQSPMVEYIKERCHYTFRWWYEYSGGKMTDWGAHHVDIAQWALNQNGEGQGVLELDPLVGSHPIDLENGMPTKDNFYNTSNNFHIKCLFPRKVEMNIVSKSEEGNGILFDGSKGSMFVSRSKLSGEVVKELKENPLGSDTIEEVYKGKKITNHMDNFFASMNDRTDPISDVYTHHRAMTTCHLANIAIRLGRKLKWNPKTEQIVGDEDANQWQSREQRSGFETKG